MKVYISGPITGRENLNREAFAKATQLLRAHGYEAVNPFEVCQDPPSWAAAMRADIAALVGCDVIALLPGWRESRGAQLEHRIAVELGMHAVYFAEEAC